MFSMLFLDKRLVFLDKRLVFCRCIASYESPQLEQFSLCVLQKHNCLGLHADIPPLPDPAPLPSFRGQALTHELAEDLFIGMQLTLPDR